MPGLLLATEAVTAHLEFFRNLRYQSTGMFIVLLSLSVLALVVAIVARVLVPRHHPPGHSTAQYSSTSAIGTIAPEIQAVIAAAVVVILKSPHRIHEVRPAANPNLSAWSEEGRRQIFQSHIFRR